MHGPYHAQVRIQGETLVLRPESGDLDEGKRLAERFYSDATLGQVEGATRAAAFATALLLEPGMQAEVEVMGYVADDLVGVRLVRVRRDDEGRLHSTLGSRFNERIWKGV